jgi:undecaprenyl phosphate-alpha-L-ara4FN deformylase
MPETVLAIKVDVDTDRGTRLGVPALLQLFDELDIRATFLFALGPDNTGRAIKRIFRPGFFSKVARTGVVSVYGVRTLLNGVVLPGPHIGRRNEKAMRSTRELGHEVGIHCYDHVRWQDGLATMTRAEVASEFGRARDEFKRIFGVPARTAGAAGWQANAHSLAAYDTALLAYASDARGEYPFTPRVGGVVYRTPQIPTTLPTLDELLGRPGYPLASLADRYCAWLRPNRPNVWTIHAELEGMAHHDWFLRCLRQMRSEGVKFVRLEEIAATLGKDSPIPICDLIAGEIDGRSGTLAVQKISSGR